MQKISNKNANRSLNITCESDIDIKKMAKVLNDDCKKVIFVMAMDQKVVEFTASFAAKKIQNWWRLATGYRVILNKIWDAYQRDEYEILDCLNLDMKFLKFVGNASVMHEDYIIHEEAVQWYLQYRYPCVFCKEFMDIFYNVEEQEPDYDYRDWKTSGKWLIFASYINSCGGLDEWNWLQVFYGIMLEKEEKENDWEDWGGAGAGEVGGMFSCDTWLSRELKKYEFRGFSRRQIIYITNGFSPTLRLLNGLHEDICTKNYFLLEKVLKSGKDMNFSELQRLLDYFVIAPNLEDNALVKGNIEKWRVFEQHLIEELCGLVSSSLAEDFRHRLAVKLLHLMFKLSNKWEEYRFTWLICEAILDGRFAKNTLYEDVLMFNGDTRLSVNILKYLGVLRFEI
ncbi:MAG: hypothetical protein HN986_03660 [Candidatus Marinimicrobia bacterium]|nr:hypothetical protein [Candidatus Neomarinimicrobiota bacterium]